ncbi:MULTISPECIES: sensor histidine kinase [Olivibacter]|jgi:signal transduction histidine kinase|uniref:histidine kinase n=3 Tax=Sphingobacteriaceae TaxID=84566 RepID=F4C165_SPHS2|nr:MULTISPECIES: HAMP domain-containing sensor histidine kinase [Olivibacter]MCL4639879.1 HAMP domain-containing histidine kinase [Olivibacter sp. UJ_SKK_5.1]MDX3912295.1 HAMP domain-containing sensor histidine kinase [Pseudosphingobacterium sp.]QEL00022.1 HAMP domain-containing histidine kinase [Olivibacter sp. LS-1]
MNPYQHSQRWKFLLLIFAAIIATASLWYTNFLVQNLSEAERTKASVWAISTRNMYAMPDVNDEYITYIYSVRDSLKVPAIITDSKDSIIYYRGLDSTKTLYNVTGENQGTNLPKYDPEYFDYQLAIMKERHPPIEIELSGGEKWYVYYKDSLLLTQLRVFPYVQLTLIAIFLGIAYTVFNSMRKSEQNQVWVGLAKETAHQLGTPISSLMAWLELMKAKFDAEEDPLLIEMENDVKRLEIVADRFSKIGSKPVLENHAVYPVVSNFVRYFKVRTSDKIKFSVSGDKTVEAQLSVPLFDWVIENILKNAANAIESAGEINIIISENIAKEQIFIDISDTGKGIPRNKFDAVFQPGYTTRKRGWGLGLSLTKRIIENYHKGQIFVKDSEVGKGTTFRIVLKSSLTYEPAKI